MADPSDMIPGGASLLAIVGGVLVVLLAPVYAVLAFADDHDGPAWSLVALTIAGLAGVWSGARLRRGGAVPPVVMLAFSVTCAGAGIIVQVRHGTTKPAILLGALGVALPLFLIAEKGWLAPSPEAPLSDG